MSRILHIWNYLSRNTDADRGATLKEIQSYLQNHTDCGNVTILTIRRDIDDINASGYDVWTTKGLHNTYYYHMSEWGFTFNELRFLVDSVSINKFLNNEQKQNLFRKFEVLCSAAEVRKLVGLITLSDVAPPALDLLDNLECVHRIIAEKRKIRFLYGKYNVHRVIEYYDKKRDLIPCRVVYAGERFYLKAVSEETGEVRSYRIDRMRQIVPGEKFKKMPRLPKADGAVVDVFLPSTYEDVRLRVRRFLLDDMIEQLGNYAHIRKDDKDPENYVLVRARIGIGYGFYRWIMKYGANVEVLSPAHLREETAEELRKACRLYEDVPE